MARLAPQRLLAGPGFPRATAIGTFLGLVASAAVAAGSPELIDSPGRALLLAGPVTCIYVALAWGVSAVLKGLDRVAARLGAAPGSLVSRSVLWSVGLLVIGHSAVNDLARLTHALDPWKPWLRAILLLGFGIVVVRSLGQRPPTPGRWERFERGLAWGAAVALVLTALFFAVERGGQARASGEVIALTPSFEPESPEVLQASATEPRSRVLVIGLDGASWDRIDRGVAAGRLPSFERLLARGQRASLETLYPTHSPLIWNSIATGVAPREHGIEDFYLTQLPRLQVERLRLPRSLDLVEDALQGLGELRRVPVTSSLRRRKTIWNLADEAGLRSVVIGFWASWPPEALRHGLVVSDHTPLAKRQEWLDRGKTSRLTVGSTTHPESLAEELAPLQRSPESVTREELAQFVAVDDEVWREFQEVREFSKRVDLSAFRSSHLNDAFYFAAARKLWDREHPDLLFVYAKAIDELSHFFLEAGVPEAAELGYGPQEIARYGGVVDRAYEWTDRQIAPLVEAVDRDGDALLMLVSDHGWERERDGGYNHSFAPPGILLLYGADVCPDCASLESASVYDVAPTVLERLRLPVSDELRGRPLLELFDKPHPLVRVERYGAALGRARSVSSERDAALTEKLEALGYVE